MHISAKAAFAAVLLAAVLGSVSSAAAQSVESLPKAANIETVLVESRHFSGEGTAEQPYLIESADDLSFLAEKINAGDTALASACYRQNAPLVLRSHTPIGTESTPFTGTYDGGGYEICFEELATFSEQAYVGLFGYAVQASFCNIVLVGDIHAEQTKNDELNAGFLCGYYTAERRGNAFVTNCEALGSLTVSTTRGSVMAGGLIGQIRLRGTTLRISDCYVGLDVSTSGKIGTYTGGICGLAHATNGARVTYVSCVYNGTLQSGVQDYFNFCGGIAGRFVQDDGWIATATAVLADESTDSLSACLVHAQILLDGGTSRYNGSLVGYGNDNVTVDRCYTLTNELERTVQSINGEPTVQEELFDKAILTDRVGYDFSESWVALADKSGLRRVSHYRELVDVTLPTDLPNTRRFQPINCENGLFAATFYDASERITAARCVSFASDESFTIPLPDALSMRVFLFSDRGSLKPLIRKPLYFIL